MVSDGAATDEDATDPLAERLAALGWACIFVAVAALACCLYVASAQLQNLSGAEALSRGNAAMSARSPSAARELLERAATFAVFASSVRSLFAVAFMLAAGVLARIGLRLRRGERQGLSAARTWSTVGLALIALAATTEALMLPRQLELVRQLAEASHMAAPPAGDAARLGWGFAIIAGVAAVLAAGPIALRFWAGALLREAAPSARR